MTLARAAFKSIQASESDALIVPTLTQNSQTKKRQKRDRANSSPRQQLELLTREPSPRRQSTNTTSTDTLPLQALYATPSACKQPGGRHWWNLRCGHNQKMFGGLYSLAERDQILNHFRERRTQINAREFGAVAERVINWSNQQRGVAS